MQLYSNNTLPPPPNPILNRINSLFDLIYPILMRCEALLFRLKMKEMNAYYFFYRVRLNL